MDFGCSLLLIHKHTQTIPSYAMPIKHNETSNRNQQKTYIFSGPRHAHNLLVVLALYGRILSDDVDIMPIEVDRHWHSIHRVQSLDLENLFNRQSIKYNVGSRRVCDCPMWGDHTLSR